MPTSALQRRQPRISADLGTAALSTAQKAAFAFECDALPYFTIRQIQVNPSESPVGPTPIRLPTSGQIRENRTMQTLPLFDDFSVSEHLQAFDGWAAMQRSLGRMRRASSEAVYRDMWGSFVAWCCAQHPPRSLGALNAQDLKAFQASRTGSGFAQDLSPRHARRLLGLIDRVLRHHAALCERSPNTAAADAIAAQPVVRYADASDATALPEALSMSEAKVLIAFLSQARALPDGDATKTLNWQQLRNCAAVGLQLGAGLTPGEVRAVELSSLTAQGSDPYLMRWKIRVPGNGNAPAREAPIAAWAADLLQHWLRVRESQAIPGTWLFPSTRTGKPWGKVAQYGAAKEVLSQAGIDETTGGSFRLRHTFAMRQLARGASLEEVAHWLGVSDMSKMARYQRMLGTETIVV